MLLRDEGTKTNWQVTLDDHDGVTGRAHGGLAP